MAIESLQRHKVFRRFSGPHSSCSVEYKVAFLPRVKTAADFCKADYRYQYSFFCGGDNDSHRVTSSCLYFFSLTCWKSLVQCIKLISAKLVISVRGKLSDSPSLTSLKIIHGSCLRNLHKYGIIRTGMEMSAIKWKYGLVRSTFRIYFRQTSWKNRVTITELGNIMGHKEWRGLAEFTRTIYAHERGPGGRTVKIHAVMDRMDNPVHL